MSDVNQDDVDLNYYEGIRKGLVQALVKDKIPTDPETAAALVKGTETEHLLALAGL